jgi:hypothetical protein
LLAVVVVVMARLESIKAVAVVQVVIGQQR